MKREYVALFGSICTSERLAELPDDAARLFYTWALTQADAWGRMPGKARVLSACVWPLLGKSAAQTEKALQACLQAGLFLLCKKGDQEWIQFPDWEEKAGRLIPPARRTKYSRWPAADEAESPSPAPPPGEEKRRDIARAILRSTPEYSGVFRSTPDLDVPPVHEAMDAYFAFRRKKKWDRLLPESVEGTLKELAEFGPDGAAAAFRQSISKGWKGVFPLKSGQAYQRSNGKSNSRAIQEKKPEEKTRDLAERAAWNEWRVGNPVERPSAEQLKALIEKHMKETA